MIIQYIIDTLVSPKVEVLPFVERYGGVATDIEFTTNAQSTQKQFKKLPVSSNVTDVDCNNVTLYQELVPNSSKKSVIYWELTQPMQLVGKTPVVNKFNQQRYRGTARLIVWMNLDKLGFAEVAPQKRNDGKIHTLPSLMKAISFEGKMGTGIYANDNVSILVQRVVTDKNLIFGKYDYSKDINYYAYPYDYFALDVTFTLDTCLANPYAFPVGAEIACTDYALEPVIPPPAPIGFSFAMDGVNEFIEIPTNATYETEIEIDKPFSFGIWVKPNSVTGNMAIFNKYVPTNSFGVEMLNQGGKLRYIIGASGTVNTSTNLIVTQNVVLTAANWHHIIYTYDGSKDVSGMKIYIDGVEVPTNTTYNALSTKTTIANNEPIRVGAESLVSPFNGLINLFRFWKVELTPSEVLEEYNSGVVKPVAVQSASLIVSPDFNNSTWLGTFWEIPDLTGIAGNYTTTNMEEVDRVTDVPS